MYTVLLPLVTGDSAVELWCYLHLISSASSTTRPLKTPVSVSEILTNMLQLRADSNCKMIEV